MSTAPQPEVVPPPTVGALMRLVWLAFRKRIYEAIQEAGYTDLQPAHAMLLRYPSLADLRPTELAEQMGMSKQAVNDLLRQMEARGYLELRPDPSDGRARLITLRQRGDDLMELARRASQQIANEWAEAVGAERMHALRETLLQLLEISRRTPTP